MIKTNLLLEEYKLINTLSGNKEKLKAVLSIKTLLTQIDHSAEEIPINNIKKLTSLLTSLKNKALNDSEKAVLIEISNFNNKTLDVTK